MKAFTVIAALAASAACVSAAPGAHAGRSVKPAARKPGLRKTRVTSRKLGDASADVDEVFEEAERPQNNIFGGLGGLGSFIQPTFLLNLPMEVFQQLTEGAGGIPNLEKFLSVADIGKLPKLVGMIDNQGLFGGNIVGHAVNTAKDAADEGVARVEQIATSFADRGRGFVDLAGGKAAALFDKGVAVGSNTWQTAEETARDLREEGKAVADQAAVVAGEAATVGERAFTSAFSNPIRMENFFNLNDIVANPFRGLAH